MVCFSFGLAAHSVMNRAHRPIVLVRVQQKARLVLAITSLRKWLWTLIFPYFPFNFWACFWYSMLDLRIHVSRHPIWWNGRLNTSSLQIAAVQLPMRGRQWSFFTFSARTALPRLPTSTSSPRVRRSLVGICPWPHSSLTVVVAIPIPPLSIVVVTILIGSLSTDDHPYSHRYQSQCAQYQQHRDYCEEIQIVSAGSVGALA